MTPDKLRQLYEADLAEAVADPKAPREDRRHLSYLLAWSRRTPAGEFAPGEDDSAVWLWSDLHLGDAEVLSVFGRPFRSPEEMDDALFEAWERVVGSADTIVFLGDVAIGGLSGRRLERFRAGPGRKVLVAGNHEFDCLSSGNVDGFDEASSTLYVPGRPPLLLTHMPLCRVPPGSVNVHGHLHVGRARGSGAYINVSVEQVGYRPQPLHLIRRLARFLERRRGRVPFGSRTVGWLASLP